MRDSYWHLRNLLFSFAPFDIFILFHHQTCATTDFPKTKPHAFILSTRSEVLILILRQVDFKRAWRTCSQCNQGGQVYDGPTWEISYARMTYICFDDWFCWTLADISAWSVWNCFHFQPKGDGKVENTYLFSSLRGASFQISRTFFWSYLGRGSFSNKNFPESFFWKQIGDSQIILHVSQKQKHKRNSSFWSQYHALKWAPLKYLDIWSDFYEMKIALLYSSIHILRLRKLPLKL